MSNYINTRDLATELEELEERQQAAAQGDHYAHEDESAEPLTDEEEARMEELQALRDEIGDEWSYGGTMIPVEAAAEELSQDFTEVTWEGSNYYVRTN
jgi:hypothetical protein